MGRRVGAPKPPKAKPISEAAAQRHSWAQGPCRLRLGAQGFGSMVAELEGSMSAKPLCWACQRPRKRPTTRRPEQLIREGCWKDPARRFYGCGN